MFHSFDVNDLLLQTRLEYVRKGTRILEAQEVVTGGRDSQAGEREELPNDCSIGEWLTRNTPGYGTHQHIPQFRPQ